MGSVDNIFIGHSAGGGTWTNAASNYNVAIGNYSMDSALDGALNNTAVGYQALSSITTADENTAVGHTSMLGITTGGYNTAVGIQSLYRNQTGTGNVAIGKGAMEGVPSNSHSSNTAVGFESLN